MFFQGILFLFAMAWAIAVLVFSVGLLLAYIISKIGLINEF